MSNFGDKMFYYFRNRFCIFSMIIIGSFCAYSVVFAEVAPPPVDLNVDQATTKYVNAAIKLKEGGLTEELIIEHLYKMADQDYKSTGQKSSSGLFGNMVMSPDDLASLRQKGFSDDFIKNMEGYGKPVSIGVAAVWLNKSANLVVSPILRIPFTKRSFYDPARSKILSSDFIDLNFGYTTSTPTQKNGSTGEKANYILVGLSYELKRTVFFNGGWAIAPGDVQGNRTQYYIGLTLDLSILQQLGIAK
jgi:hypothetical protein